MEPELQGVEKVRGGSRILGLARWTFSHSPWLIRRPAQLAAVYGASFVAVKALDKAHEKWPSNLGIAKADTAAQALFQIETDAVQLAAGCLKDAYDAIPPASSKDVVASFDRYKAQELQAEIKEEDALVQSRRSTIRNCSNLNVELTDNLPVEVGKSDSLSVRPSVREKAAFTP